MVDRYCKDGQSTGAKHEWDSRLKGSAGTESTYVYFCKLCGAEHEVDV